jgi:anti-anti-sigma factor
MTTLTRLFQWEVEDDTLILTPRIDLHDREHQQIEETKRDILNFLAKTPTKNVIIDYRNANYFWSSAGRVYLRLKKEVHLRNGRMVFCNVSQQLNKILGHPKLVGQWPICSSRTQAVEAIRGHHSARNEQRATARDARGSYE